MSDSASLVCFDCNLALYLGRFWNKTDVRVITTRDGVSAAQSSNLSRALWKMLAEHVYHDVRLLGESSSDWDELDLGPLRTIGGDRTVGGWDPTVEQYLGDWPG
jgi:hypothetical protein